MTVDEHMVTIFIEVDNSTEEGQLSIGVQAWDGLRKNIQKEVIQLLKKRMDR